MTKTKQSIAASLNLEHMTSNKAFQAADEAWDLSRKEEATRGELANKLAETAVVLESAVQVIDQMMLLQEMMTAIRAPSSEGDSESDSESDSEDDAEGGCSGCSGCHGRCH